ncbi:MAG: 16S rRNA (uracil(1498)-N(3))-methyltransferase [Propionibacteriaceae bacterium]
MTEPLFLAPLEDIRVGGLVVVTGDEGRHAVQVRRIRVGEIVLVADGAGTAIRGEVITADKNGLQVAVQEILGDQLSAHTLVAVQALAKGGRDEQAIESMTELGIDEVVPWRAQRSIVKWEAGARGEKQLTKWCSTVREAAKQSRRFTVPTVTPAYNCSQLVQQVMADATTFILHEEATQPLALVDLPEQGRIVLVVGPEGGISPEELATFVAAGATCVSVGNHVLRSSTAGVVALAQIQARLTQREAQQ